MGRRHELSAGLLIGGKDVKEEAARVAGALHALRMLRRSLFFRAAVQL